jgi:hypothetical protein
LAWHLGPELSLHGANISAQELGKQLRFLVTDSPGWSQDLRAEGYAPAYGVKIPAQTIHLRFAGPLPTELATFLQPVTANQLKDGASLHFDAGAKPAVRAYSYVHDQDRRGAAFASDAQSWSLLGWSSNADLLCYHLSGGGVKSLLVCNASFVDWQEQRLWSSPQPTLWCELARGEGGMQVVSLGPTTTPTTGSNSIND